MHWSTDKYGRSMKILCQGNEKKVKKKRKEWGVIKKIEVFYSVIPTP